MEEAEKTYCYVGRNGGEGAWCCDEFVAQVEDPNEDEPDNNNKEFYVQEWQVFSMRGERIPLCPYCGAEIVAARGGRK